MKLTIEEFQAFNQSVTVADLMAVLVDQHGRLVADQVAARAALVATGKAPKPKVIWPLLD